MFRAITRAFKDVDDFLTDCEDYVEGRVWNGKFIYDLKFLSDSKIDDIKEELVKLKNAIQSSTVYTACISFFQKLGKLLMQFQIIEDIVLIIANGLKICFKYFAHYLFVVIIGLFTTLFLLATFKYAPIVFLISLLPLLYGNHLILLEFFAFADKKEEGGRFTFADVLTQLKTTLGTTTLIFLLQVTIAVTSVLSLILFAFILSYIFGSTNIEWSSSFLYWLPVVMVALMLAIILYITEIIFSFSYSFTLQDKKNGIQAFSRSTNILHLAPRHSLLFYILLTLFSIFFVAAASTTNYEGGFAVSILFTAHAFLLLGFVLRKKYFKNFADAPIAPIEKLYGLAKPTIGFGVIAYILFAALIVQIHPDILTFLENQRPTIAENYQYNKYRNTDAGYTIDYPRPWSVYKWDNLSTTIYTNVTGTETGGIKVNINVSPIENSNYLMLYEANPGLIRYDTGTRNVTTKITNLTIRGKNAVKYTYTKTDAKQIEYEVHYLIHHNDRVYDIAFVTVSKKTEAAYLDIFERMIMSFEITSANN